MTTKVKRPQHRKSSDMSTQPIIQTNTSIERIVLRVNKLQDGQTNQTRGVYSPLYLNAIDLELDGAAGSMANSYFEQNVYTLYQKFIQRNLAFKYTLTLSDLTKSFQALSYALQLYYQTASILAFNIESGSKNSGMRHLYDLHTPEILVAHQELGEYLDKLFIPPTMNDFIYWLFDNYSFNNIPGSPVLRNSFRGSLMVINTRDGINAKLSKTLLNHAKNKLVNVSETLSMLEIMKPDWKLNLKQYNGVPKVDIDFLDYWVNSSINFVKTNGATTVIDHRPQVGDLNTAFGYYMNANDVSIKSLSLFNTRQSGVAQPGWLTSIQLIDKTKTDASTRLNYVEGELKITSDDWFNAQSGHLYCSRENTLTGRESAFYGTANCQLSVGNTLSGIEEISNKFGNWLFGLDSLK